MKHLSYKRLLMYACISQVFLCLTIKMNAQENPNELLRKGKLENGFTYIIKHMKDNHEKIEMNLIVKAGSQLEDPDQYGNAHLLEHMAFNYTKHFNHIRTNNTLLEKLQMKPEDLYAITGGYSTIYWFKFPQKVPNAIDTALLKFRDVISGNVLFDKKQLKSERKAVLQEYSYNNGKMNYPYLKIRNILRGCSDNIPKPENHYETIMNPSNAALKRFYKDWYRPDLSTLVMVGNIENINEVEKKIIESFQDVKMPKQKRQKKDCNKNYAARQKQFIVQNEIVEPSGNSLSETTFQFYFRKKQHSIKNISIEEESQSWDVLNKIIENRLKELQSGYKTNYQTSFRSVDFYPAQMLMVKSIDHHNKIIPEVFSAISGISKYGITRAELDEVIEEILNRVNNKNNNNSARDWLDIITDFVKADQPITFSNNKSKIRFLKELDVKQINRFLKNYSWTPDDIAIIQPKRTPTDKFSKKLISKWIDEGLEHPTEYQKVEAPKQLISENELKKFYKAKVEKHQIGDYSEKIFTLTNGLNIVLKEFQPVNGRYKDKIMVHGFSPYGASCLNGDTQTTLLAPFIIQNSGLGSYNKFEINKLLENTSIPFGIKNYIDQYETGVKASIAPEDLELLLQLIYLSFTDPRFDTAAFADWKKEEYQKATRNRSPNNDFTDFINKKTGLVKVPQGRERYKNTISVNHKAAFINYKKLHSRAKDFTFILTGNFKENRVLPLLQLYLGNLENNGDLLVCKNSQNENSGSTALDSNTIRFKFPYDIDNEFLSIQFRTKSNYKNFKEEIKLAFLKQALSHKLKDLRDRKNLGVYFSVAQGKIDNNTNITNLQVYLQCDSNDYEKVLSSCNEFFEELKKEEVTKAFLATIKKSSYLPKWQDESITRNKSMQQNLYDFYRYNIPLINPEKVQDYKNQFSTEDLQKAAIHYLKDNRKLIISGTSVNL